jgi:hypothetical protein
LASAAARSTAASAPEITVWPGEFRLAAATTTGFGHLGRIQRKHRGHCTLSRRDSQLHRPPASFHGAHRISKTERTGGYVGAPLAERVPGGQCRLNAVLRKHAPGRNAYGKDGRLRVLSELEIFLGPLKDQFGEREAEGLVGFGKGLDGYGEVSHEFAAHADGLRSLPWKEKSYFLLHSSEILNCRAQ